MDRDSFLKKIFSMFPMNFNENNMGYWIEAYESVFDKPIDFDKLFWVMVSNYEYTHTAPSPQWFKINLSSCIIRNDKSSALIHIENLKKEEKEPMPEDIKKKFEQLKQKLSMG